MKIAFVAHRANYLKHYGPIIDAALGRGDEVFFWFQSGGRTGKSYLNLRAETVTQLWGDRVRVRPFVAPDEIAMFVKEDKIDSAISLHSRNYYSLENLSPVNFVTLQHSIDTFVWNSPADLASSDQLCLFSPFWMEFAGRYYEMTGVGSENELRGMLDGKVAYTGFAQMDAFAQIDRAVVRKKWGLQQDQRVVLVLPIDLANWNGAWPRFFLAPAGIKQMRRLWDGVLSEGFDFAKRYLPWALRGWNDSALTEALIRFCERNNASLLVKAREKDPMRADLANSAVRAVYDDSHYPATVFEAIGAADLCILFYSTAAQEAAYAGVPALCIDRPNYEIPKHRLWRRNDVGGPYNYPGVIEWAAMAEALKNLPDWQLEDFSMDSKARIDYLQKYNGPPDNKASQRILDLLS